MHTRTHDARMHARMHARALSLARTQVLDRYFGNVCELDLIFNFHKAYYILDELLIAGEQQETSKKAVLKLITEQDAVCEEGTDKDMQ